MCKIYYEAFECGEDYIGETKRYTITRWSEHDNATKDSEPARPLNKHINHVFTWKILCHTPKKTDIHEDLEAIFISLKPSLTCWVRSILIGMLARPGSLYDPGLTCNHFFDFSR